MKSLFKVKSKKFLIIFFLILFHTSQAFWAKAQGKQNQYCLNHNRGDLVAYPKDCKEFYFCGENGESVAASCPPNMLFNAINQMCDNPKKVNCNNQNLNEPQTTPSSVVDSIPSEASQFCLKLKDQQPDSKALVFIASPLNCSQYYMCYYGKALLQECSSNLYWNDKIGKCDLPSKVNCHNGDLDDSNSIQISPAIYDSSDQENQNFLCPLYGQHIFPHMERCDFFIYCVKGFGILQKCPFFHWFDVASGTCRWRTNALCIKDLNLKFRLKKKIEK